MEDELMKVYILKFISEQDMRNDFRDRDPFKAIWTEEAEAACTTFCPDSNINNYATTTRT